ncbi:pyrroline-5-carboxylate reductase [Mesoterricola sediminis]|uniref:Pyrroline-5-carboxylate reductase n=1 Tax=Mesoterricola sediminis TaxID=2927980 RepID=A0AA48KDV1_9BACT|nr:pyrroline-5-carboxylate reductase [Mesoterricola sediminis]BDU78591.1 pyrroline-5-carboxylate reductase [Mesoterricola sediminis]
MTYKLAIVGFGTMGQAICGGLVEAAGRPPAEVIVCDKGKGVRARAEALGVAWAASPADAARQAEAVLLCVKPKDLGAVLDGLRTAGALDHDPLVVSIAAGVDLAYLEGRVKPTTPVVRAMPNTPCSIRMGTTVLAPGREATEAHLAVARTFFEPLGAVIELEEPHFDAVTGLSASGPAFIFVILEALAEGGVQCGLPRAVAVELAARMTLGSAAMVLQTGRHPAALKDEVTTPAGCTIAGLLALEDGRIRSVLARGIERAAQVAGGLGK